MRAQSLETKKHLKDRRVETMFVEETEAVEVSDNGDCDDSITTSKSLQESVNEQPTNTLEELPQGLLSNASSTLCENLREAKNCHKGCCQTMP